MQDHVEWPVGDSGPTNGKVAFAVECADDGDHRVQFQMEVIAPNGNSDSVNITTANDGDEPSYWPAGRHPDWGWSSDSPEITLKGGLNEVHTNGREDGIQIRRIRFRPAVDYHVSESGQPYCDYGEVVGRHPLSDAGRTKCDEAVSQLRPRGNMEVTTGVALEACPLAAVWITNGLRITRLEGAMNCGTTTNWCAPGRQLRRASSSWHHVRFP